MWDFMNNFINITINIVKSTKTNVVNDGLRKLMVRFKDASETEIEDLPKIHVAEMYVIRIKLIYGIALFSSILNEEYDSITACANLVKLCKRDHVLTCDIPNTLKKIVYLQSNRTASGSKKMRDNFSVFTDETTLFGYPQEQLSDSLIQLRIYSISNTYTHTHITI